MQYLEVVVKVASLEGNPELGVVPQGCDALLDLLAVLALVQKTIGDEILFCHKLFGFFGFGVLQKSIRILDLFSCVKVSGRACRSQRKEAARTYLDAMKVIDDRIVASGLWVHIGRHSSMEKGRYNWSGLRRKSRSLNIQCCIKRES